MLRKFRFISYLYIFTAFLWINPIICEYRLEESDVHEIVSDILDRHAVYHILDEEVFKRALERYIESLDPAKTYFLEREIYPYINPTEQNVQEWLDKYHLYDYDLFVEIHDIFKRAIKRRRAFDINLADYNFTDADEDIKMSDLDWAGTEEQIRKRVALIQHLQQISLNEVDEETRILGLSRIEKYLKSREDDYLNVGMNNPSLIYTGIIKAVASALDPHTAYFTPQEAEQFQISVQQRLFGIGAQLRDDITGLTIVRVIEGGPASTTGLLKEDDKIIAVDGTPIIGMEITDSVDMIRGPEGTSLTLTIIRKDEKGSHKTIDISLERGEVLLKETRLKSFVEPYGDGFIGYCRLFSFYQDKQFSAASDLKDALRYLKETYPLKGFILDLRSNSGGVLTQAVDVAGLFLKRGIVVSIKDEEGVVRHLRNFEDGLEWEGPLIVLVNKASASDSEIVAQALKDYKRAIIVGDQETFGKGTYQVFTLNSVEGAAINPKGEYKVTRGRYYTVSGVSPQLAGVSSDIVVKGPLSGLEIGERELPNPLSPASISASFEDKLEDLTFFQRQTAKKYYLSNDMQEVMNEYSQWIPLLEKNSKERLLQRLSRQQWKKEMGMSLEDDDSEKEKDDLVLTEEDQLQESFNVMRDLIFLTKE